MRIKKMLGTDRVVHLFGDTSGSLCYALCYASAQGPPLGEADDKCISVRSLSEHFFYKKALRISVKQSVV